MSRSLGDYLASTDIDEFVGYPDGDDKMLFGDVSTNEMMTIRISQIQGEITSNGAIGANPSLAEIAAAIPSPAIGRSYLLQGSGGNTFICIYDGSKWWYEKMTEAT